MQELNIKNYAHIGDAVYEVFIRERTILLTSNLQRLHKFTIQFVNAAFQTELLEKIYNQGKPPLVFTETMSKDRRDMLLKALEGLDEK